MLQGKEPMCQLRALSVVDYLSQHYHSKFITCRDYFISIADTCYFLLQNKRGGECSFFFVLVHSY